MKLRAYLVDDEPLAIERLRRLLEHTERVKVTGSTSTRRVLLGYPDAASERL
jgi:DNA-binding NarL/FixJ family response regulator